MLVVHHTKATYVGWDPKRGHQISHSKGSTEYAVEFKMVLGDDVVMYYLPDGSHSYTRASVRKHPELLQAGN